MEVIANSIYQKRDYLTQLDNEIILKCNMDDIDCEVDESTEICTRINESILKLRGYINAHGNSIETRTDA